ncbi:MAG TPA: hypothetical protein VK901_16310 [Nitrospiraceae bacterium]|nr:hypothetical protein [Nitrospiraceae bacterium]
MPRNDQVTRQWHVLQRLEASKRGLTLDELLAGLPSDLARHPRTIRRDLEALEAAHFPLLSERVDGCVRWRLLDGFRNVPALGLSPTELMALAFSRRLCSSLSKAPKSKPRWILRSRRPWREFHLQRWN